MKKIEASFIKRILRISWQALTYCKILAEAFDKVMHGMKKGKEAKKKEGASKEE